MMRMNHLLLALLAGLACQAAADTPYRVQGLHTDLTLDEATALSRTLGGQCRETRARRKVGGRSVLCEFNKGCQESTDVCPGALAGSLTIGGQPVQQVEIEAHGEGIQVSNISIFLAGDHLAVIAALRDLFGEPGVDTAVGAKQSWNTSRRLLWQQGRDRASLIDNPQMILLARDPPRPEAPD